MAKLIKMALYGEPGVGKSTFAAKAPKPFFITTDGNYEYLEDFCGSNPEDHIQVNSWKEMKAAFGMDFSKYETIVVDLLEDSYMWAENEFCKDNKIAHISDLGYGKGYGILANDFFIEYQKLLALPKNIILIMHGVTEVLKDRRGVEYTKYGPSKLVREKIITQIEGRTRFFVRAFAETTEDENGNLLTKRYLSLSPDGQTEYGITRGLSGDVPRYIPLDWDIFYEIATKNDPVTSSVSVKHIENVKKEDDAKRIAESIRKSRKTAVKAEAPVTEAPVEETPAAEVNPIEEIRKKLKAVTTIEDEEGPVAVETPAPEPKVVQIKEPAHPVSENEVKQVNDAVDKMAAIKAKMAALKGLNK